VVSGLGYIPLEGRPGGHRRGLWLISDGVAAGKYHGAIGAPVSGQPRDVPGGGAGRWCRAVVPATGRHHLRSIGQELLTGVLLDSWQQSRAARGREEDLLRSELVVYDLPVIAASCDRQHANDHRAGRSDSRHGVRLVTLAKSLLLGGRLTFGSDPRFGFECATPLLPVRTGGPGVTVSGMRCLLVRPPVSDDSCLCNGVSVTSGRNSP
jgi:hypothetical protein